MSDRSLINDNNNPINITDIDLGDDLLALLSLNGDLFDDDYYLSNCKTPTTIKKNNGELDIRSDFSTSVKAPEIIN